MPEQTPKFTPSEAPVDTLHLDPENPRLPEHLRGADEESVLDYMISQGDIAELAVAIAAQGYFPGEPLLVAPLDAPEGATDPPGVDEVPSMPLVVVEGNRRLAAMKLLRAPHEAPRRAALFQNIASEAAVAIPDTVPVIAFAHRQLILRYLGFRHVKGVKEWKPLEKARYLRDLRESAEDKSNQGLARNIGSKADYVGRLLATLELFDSIKATLQDVSFSLLTTALSYASIREWIGLEPINYPDVGGADQERLEKLASWLFEPVEGAARARVGESRNLRYIAKLIESDDAIAAFEGGATPAQAAMRAEAPDVIVPAAILQAHQPLSLAHTSAPGLTTADPDTAMLAQDCHNWAGDLSDRLAELLNGAAESSSGGESD